LRLRARQPQWWPSEKSSSILKRALLGMPTGSKRPSSSSQDPNERRLGEAIASYTRAGRRGYDEDFHKALLKRFPHWKIRAI